MENSQQITIEQFDPQQGTPAEWQIAFKFRREYHDIINPDEPYLPDEAWKQNFLLQLESGTMDFEIFLVKTDNELVGIGNIAAFTSKAPGYEDNKHTGFCGLEILPRFRNQGIAKRLLHLIYQEAEKRNLKMLVGGTLEEAGREFIKTIGGHEALANIDNRLVLSEVDWDMVENWAQTGQQKNPDTKIEEYDTIPQEKMEAYLKAYESTLRQVPTGEMEMTLTTNEQEIREMEERRRKTGKVSLRIVTVEPDQSISGVTALIYDSNLPTVLYQGLTGVVEDQRGRGLGKWIKAEALLRARDRYQDAKYIKTDNATTNAPMISINERLGFREFRRSYNLQVPLSNLKEYLDKQ